MKQYTTKMEYRFWADDEDHAIDQLINMIGRYDDDKKVIVIDEASIALWLDVYETGGK